MIILLKYVENTRWREKIENGARKWIQGCQIRQRSPPFIDTMGKSWPSDE